MTFSDGFSDSFSKETQEQLPESGLGLVTTQFYRVFGARDIGTITQEINEVLGDWKIGDFSP